MVPGVCQKPLEAGKMRIIKPVLSSKPLATSPVQAFGHALTDVREVVTRLGWSVGRLVGCGVWVRRRVLGVWGVD